MMHAGLEFERQAPARRRMRDGGKWAEGACIAGKKIGTKNGEKNLVGELAHALAATTSGVIVRLRTDTQTMQDGRSG